MLNLLYRIYLNIQNFIELIKLNTSIAYGNSICLKFRFFGELWYNNRFQVIIN